jgi:hypothetical protein
MTNAGPKWFSIQHESRGQSWGMTSLLFLYGLVLWSPLPVALGVRWSYLLVVIALLTCAVGVVTRRPVKLWFLIMSALYLFMLAVPAAYWMEVRYLLSVMPFLVAVFMVSQATPQDIERMVDWASWFTLAMLLLGALAFLLALGGMPPLYDFPRPDVNGGSLYFFGTTFTNLYRPPVMRPAGIYDEPGALSFVVCAVAFMRHALGKDYKLTWVLLALGFVTLSLAHLVFVAVFFMAERLSVRKIAFALVLAAAVGVSLLSPAVRVTFSDYVVTRLVNSSRGDNRLGVLLNAWDIIVSDGHVVYVGVDPACSFDTATCDLRYPPRGENPLQPLAERGLFGSWPYYLFLATALALAVRSRRNLPFFALALLFLQRPYVLSFGYALLGVTAYWLQLVAYPRTWRTLTTPRRTRDLVWGTAAGAGQRTS